MGATTLTSSSSSSVSYGSSPLLLLLLLLVCFLSAASPPPLSSLEFDGNQSFSLLLFLECLMTSGSTTSHISPYNLPLPPVDDVDVPLSSVIYTRDNSSYPAVLDAHVRNLRFTGAPATSSPFLIVTPLHASHIQSTVLCARRHGVHMKIRSGGHDYEGLSYASRHPPNHPFFLLDMFNLRSIRMLSTSSAWVETGATLGELFYTISRRTNNTRAFPAGICPTVGVGGHLTAGGYGPLMRKYGLSADNVLDAMLVDADGRILNRRSMGEDLFWAIRGGGAASFGVVVAYKIRLVRVPRNVTVFRVERTADADEGLADTVAKWLSVAYKMTDDLFIRLTMEVVSSNSSTKSVRATFRALYLGGNSDDLVSLMRDTVPGMGVVRSDCHEMSWAHSVVFWHFPPGTPADEALLSRTLPCRVYHKRKSDYLTEPITKEGIDRIWERMLDLAAAPSPSPYLAINPYGGRMWDLPEDGTPFPHRKGCLYKIQYLMDWTEGGPEAADRYVGLTRDLYAFMSQFVSKEPRASFFNYKDIDLGINTHGKWAYYEAMSFGLKYFKSNFHRLVTVKTKVDPTDFFRNEQSIPLLPQNVRHNM